MANTVTLAEQQALFQEKNAYLNQFCDEVEPLEFYRDIFPQGSFERKGHLEDNKGNGLALEIPDRGHGLALQLEDSKGKATHHIVTDNLEELEELQGSPFTIMSPISYYGRRRNAKNARFLYAMVFDLDGVGRPQLRDVLHQMRNDVIPTATYIVNSGTGLHLYYVLMEPVPMYPQNQKFLKELKYGLTRRVWNGYTSTLEVPQMQSIMQGFRVVGSCSKLGPDYPVTAWRYGDKVSLEYLVDALPYEADRAKVRSILHKSTLSLEQAKKKYPDWYDRRIVQGEKRGRWVVKRDLYDWWLRRIRTEITVGHRFFGIMTLAVYAKKCNITEEELRQDAFSLLDLYDEKTDDETNHFTEEDILKALEMFNEDYVTFPRATIERVSGIPVPANKRNGRKRATHVRLMNRMKEFKKEFGEPLMEGRPVGSKDSKPRKQRPGMEQTIQDYMAAHPEQSVSEVAAALGCTMKTVYKWRKKEAQHE